MAQFHAVCFSTRATGGNETVSEHLCPFTTSYGMLRWHLCARASRTTGLYWWIPSSVLSGRSLDLSWNSRCERLFSPQLRLPFVLTVSSLYSAYMIALVYGGFLRAWYRSSHFTPMSSGDPHGDSPYEAAVTIPILLIGKLRSLPRVLQLEGSQDFILQSGSIHSMLLTHKTWHCTPWRFVHPRTNEGKSRPSCSPVWDPFVHEQRTPLHHSAVLISSLCLWKLAAPTALLLWMPELSSLPQETGLCSQEGTVSAVITSTSSWHPSLSAFHYSVAATARLFTVIHIQLSR